MDSQQAITRIAIGENVEAPTDFDLAGYRFSLTHWASKANRFSEFNSTFSDELRRLGFSHWSYMRLDLPIHLAVKSSISTFDKRKFKSYTEDKLYLHDFSISHIIKDNSAVYMVDIDNFIRCPSLVTREFLANQQIIDVFKSESFNDYISIPLCTSAGAHSLFTLAIKGKSHKVLRKQVAQHADHLKILIEVFETVGIDIFFDQFLGEKTKYEKMLNNKSMKLLDTMMTNDFNICEAANAMNMNMDAAYWHIEKVRTAMGASTNHGAYIKAIKEKYLSMD